VTPLGLDIETTWSRLVAGESAGSVITAFPSEGHPVRIACEAGAFEPERKPLFKRILSGLAAIGVFISTLTDSGPGATVATTILAIGSQIVDNLSATHAVHPFLLTHGWLAYADLFRSPIEWSAIRQGLVIDAVYTAIFLAAAGWWFSRKDVTS